MLEPHVVTQQINSRVESVLHETSMGEKIPFGCLVCDEFLKPKDIDNISVTNLKQVEDVLKSSNWNAVIPHIVSCYKFKVHPALHDSLDLLWMNDMLLSPRGCYIKSTDDRRKKGFCMCSKCKKSLHKEIMLRFAIANKYCFGTPPQCLVKLTEVEVTMLTTVKIYGFIYWML